MKNILIIEDEILIQQSLKKMLLMRNYLNFLLMQWTSEILFL